ncbi:15120_t:CDS:1, partial [Cetraspora pellucida]
EELNKDDLLLNNDLNYNKISRISKNNLVLFLETNLDLEDEIFIDDLEKFSNDKNDKNLLLEINEIVENIETNEVLKDIA